MGRPYTDADERADAAFLVGASYGRSSMCAAGSRLLRFIDELCEDCEPSRGCSLCELLLAAQPLRDLIAKES